MRKAEIHRKLEELVKEIETTDDNSTLWDNDIKESLVKLRKHVMHVSGNTCSCCNGSGVS